MSNRRRIRPENPRRLPGDMIDAGTPHSRNSVVLDARHAILMDTVEVSTLDPDNSRGQGSAIAMLLGGRINQTEDVTKVLFLFGTDGAAAIITQLIALMGRATGIDSDQMMKDILDRWNDLKEEGNIV